VSGHEHKTKNSPSPLEKSKLISKKGVTDDIKKKLTVIKWGRGEGETIFRW
jgi:hypothetical protein